MEPVSTASAPHYVWGEQCDDRQCDGWHLASSEALSVIEERMPPGTAERRHFHRRARQFFYVLAGELTLELGGAEHVLSPGRGLEIAPEQPHQAFNRGSQDVRFLVVSQPPSHGDRIEA